MTNPYPLPRFLRQTAVLMGNGGQVYGPFSGFSIWDTADIEVWWRPSGQDNFTQTGVTVAKTTADAFSPFTVTFPAGVPNTTQFVVASKRLHDRTAGVMSGTMISPDALEKEISRQGTVLQELRRDVDRSIKMAFDNTGTPYEVAPGIGGRSTLVLENGRVKAGPTVDELEDWKDRAEVAAVNSENSAIASHNSAIRAERARDIAAGYASDAVSQGNVPVYATATGLTELDIPDGINFIRTNGYYSADGSGAAKYRLMDEEEADLPGQIVSNGGAKRWAIAEQILDISMFGILSDENVDNGPLLASILALGRVTTAQTGVYFIDDLQIPAGSRFYCAGKSKTFFKRRSTALGAEAKGIVKLMGSNVELHGFTIDLNFPGFGNIISGLSPMASLDNVAVTDVKIQNGTFNGLDWSDLFGALSFNDIQLDVEVENVGWIGAKLEGINRGRATIKVYRTGFNAIEVEGCSGGFTVDAYSNKSQPASKQFSYPTKGSYSASSTSLTVATGAKVLTITAGRDIRLGHGVYIRSASDPDGVWMWGKVTDYTGTALSVDVTQVSGSGIFADWQIDAEGGMLLWRGIHNNGVVYENPVLIDNRNAREDGMGIGEVGQISTTSITLGTGTKTFTIAAGIDYRLGDRVSVFATSNPKTHVMSGLVTGYAGTELTLAVDAAAGSGTFNSWQINVESGIEVINNPFIYRAGLFGLDLQSNNKLTGGVIEEAMERGLEIGYDLGGVMKNVIASGVLIKNTGGDTTTALPAGVFVGNGSWQLFRDIQVTGCLVVDDRSPQKTQYGFVGQDNNAFFVNFTVDDTNNFKSVATSPISLFGSNDDIIIQNHPIVFTANLVWAGPTAPAIVGNSYKWVSKTRIKLHCVLYTGTGAIGSENPVLGLPVPARDGGASGTAFTGSGVRAGTGDLASCYIDNGGSLLRMFAPSGFAVDAYYSYSIEYDV